MNAEEPRNPWRTERGAIQVEFRAQVRAAIHPMLWSTDPRLGGEFILDQPQPDSKSARNMTAWYEANGRRDVDIVVRAYYGGGDKIDLYGPERPLGFDLREGYRGGVRADSRPGLKILALMDELRATSE